MYRNQQNLYPRIPTAIAKLLHYSGLGSNSGMSFLRTNDLRQNSEFVLDYGILVKTVEVDGVQAEK